MTLSDKIISDLIAKGVTTYFGVQGGACARLIESVIKLVGNTIQCLMNSQQVIMHMDIFSNTKTSRINIYYRARIN